MRLYVTTSKYDYDEVDSTSYLIDGTLFDVATWVGEPNVTVHKAQPKTFVDLDELHSRGLMTTHGGDIVIHNGKRGFWRPAVPARTDYSYRFDAVTVLEVDTGVRWAAGLRGPTLIWGRYDSTIPTELPPED